MIVQCLGFASSDFTVASSDTYRELPEKSFGFVILNNKNVDEIKADVASIKTKISSWDQGEVLFVQLIKYGLIFKKYRAAIILYGPKADLAEFFAGIPWESDFIDKAGVKLYYESTQIIHHPGTPATPNNPGTPPSTEHKPVYSTLRVKFDDIREALDYFREWKSGDSWEFLRKNDYWSYRQHVSNLHHKTDIAFFSSLKFDVMIFDSMFPILYQRVVDITGEEILRKIEKFYK